MRMKSHAYEAARDTVARFAPELTVHERAQAARFLLSTGLVRFERRLVDETGEVLAAPERDAR